MNTFSEPLESLNRRFWDEVHPCIRERVELDQIEVGQFISGGASPITGQTYPPEILEKTRFLADRVSELVRAELFDVSHMHFSCPTRFAIMYFEAVVRHYKEVKRKYMSSDSPHHRRDLFGNYYDVERDIAILERAIKEFRDGHLKTERHYFEAFDQQRFDDAGALLSAIEIQRRSGDVVLRNEASNWRIDLACATGNVTMFATAWQCLPEESAVKKETLWNLLEKLLYVGVISGIAVVLTAEGERSALRSGNRQKFADDQVRHLIGNTIKEIASWLIAKSPKTVSARSFLATVGKEFESSRRAALAANPLLANLKVIYRPGVVC